MAISPKGITLHEGFNDLGTFEIDITNVEQPVTDEPTRGTPFNPSVQSNKLLFRLELLSGDPVPTEYRSVFTVKGRVESEWVLTEAYPGDEGFIEIEAPQLPVVVRKIPDGTPEETVIRYTIKGSLDERAEETYMAVVSGSVGPLYTLIWDFFVRDGHLTVFDGVENYYELGEDIEVGSDITAIHITNLGVVFGYDGVMLEWVSLGTLEFTRIEFPENLISFSDGFYMESGTSGDIDNGNLGSGIFDGYTLEVNNADRYLVDVALSIFLPGSLVYSGTFNNVMPGNSNYIPVVIDGSAYTAPDLSPTISEIETLSGITFSAEFLDFLTTKELGTLEAVRKAGPIKYINGFPAEDVGDEELFALQSHTDLYTVNKDAEINQHLIGEGYGRMYDIANTPKDIFVSDVVGGDLTLFRAAQIHEVAVQNQKLVSNMLANRLSDMRMAESAIPFVPGNNFPAAELHAVASTCGCDDCKSGISPFAYMIDLLKYGAAHIDNSAEPYSRGGTPQHLENFVGMIEDDFLQPFGELNVSCETLHDEFCRVRLVTEVLEKQWLLKSGSFPNNVTPLAVERNKYLTLVYKTILTQAGSSINEVRDIVAMPYGEEKTKAVDRWTEKMGLPVYVPSTSTLTVEAIWLTIGNANPSNQLTAGNVEALFGYRNTLRDVLTVTPVGYVEQWRDIYLRAQWKKQDYTFTDYSREGVIAGNTGTYKANWQPIVDPDNIAWEDMTYIPGTDTKAMWLHRRVDTDDFISAYFNSPPVMSLTADINARIVRARGLNIIADVIEDNIIQLYDPVGTSWEDFEVLSRKLSEANTDVILKKSTPVLPQPPLFQAAFPALQLYQQELSMDGLIAAFPAVTSAVSFSLSFSSEVFLQPGTYMKLRSVVGSNIYEYETGALPGITSVTYNANKRTVDLIITDAGGVPGTFNTGVITMTFDRSIPYMLYNKVVTMGDLATPAFPTVADGVPFTIEFNNETFFNQTGTLKIKSITGLGTYIYDTDVSPGIDDVSFNADHKEVTLTINDAALPVDFDSGTITLYYEKNIPLQADTIINPEDLVEAFFTDTLTYTLLDATTQPYEVWDVAAPWPPSIDPSLSNYGKVKQMQQLLAAGVDLADFNLIIKDYLHTTVPAFNRIMELLISCENYSNSMYCVTKPVTADVYEILSIARACAKNKLRGTWVAEEIEFGTAPIYLDGQVYWKSLVEPIAGEWDPSQQTDNSGVPIIDPEILSSEDMLDIVETQDYIQLYNTRITDLKDKFDEYIAFVNSSDDDAFQKMLNDIATDATATDYSIAPYTTLTGLLADLTGVDVFKQKYATEIINATFSLSADEFIQIMPVISAYENDDAQLTPSFVESQKVTRILVSAYKRMQFYPGTGGWIDEENTFTPKVYYYNVRKMKMAPGRTNPAVRTEWQRTLAAWNRMPFIQPDIVPPENVKNFILANPIYTTWNLRKIALINAYNTLTSTYIYPGAGNADDLLLNLQGQIDLVVGRIFSFVPATPPFGYYPFFEAIKTHEANGDDIRPYVAQQGFTVTEYRYLANIIKVLEGAGAGPIPLLDTEYEDIKNILIAVRSRNLTFADVLYEYNNNITLSPDYFQNYKKPLSNFPLTDLVTPNPWRSPQRLRKDWADKLESREEREKVMKDEWKEVLKEAEDRNMPLMRDALIRALTGQCLNWQTTAEKLAKTFFIETKDNCCFKHTRVSFAIETLQGFYFSLANGIFDDFVADNTLFAPDFKKEWEWLGTYSAWRSAMFVFLYPENLLYPTLKRFQSPKFVELAQKLQAANRFSPQDACDAGHEYDKYLADMQDLNLICSTSSRCLYSSASAHDCCDTNGTFFKEETYTFAQGRSGIPYWCIKQTQLHDGLDFWQPLPIETKDIKIIGCAVFGTRWDGWKDFPLALYLFYTYRENGKTKMAYIKRPLQEPDPQWTGATDCEDIPLLDEAEPANIMLCQNSEDWAEPTFIFSYNKVVNVYKTFTIYQPWNRTVRIRPNDWWQDPNPVTNTFTSNIIESSTSKMHLAYSYNIKDDKFISANYEVLNSIDKPEVAIRHLANPPWLDMITTVFPAAGNYLGYANIGLMGRQKNFEWHPGNNSTYAFKNIVGGFDGYFFDAVAPATPTFSIVIHHKDLTDNYRVTRIEIDPYKLNDYIVNNLNPANTVVGTNISSNIPKDLVKIYPFSQERGTMRGYAVKDTIDRLLSIKILDASTTANYCILTPETVSYVPVKSAECITNITARKTDVEAQMKKNMSGAAPGWIKRPMVITELMYEAYYFVPMLLALDQQKRGQYDSALSWYRSVYDYTQYNQATRKIFYGLKLEETITNSYTQNANWLLDPLNPHLVAQTRTNAYTKYTIMNIVQCMFAYADRQYTLDTIETLPIARKLYTTALELLRVKEINVQASLCEENANNCVSTLAPAVANNPNWANQTARVQNNLQRVANPETIDSLAEEIAALLNAGDEETMASKFAEAFDLIDEHLPPAPEPESVTTVTTSSAERFNAAYSYVFATNNQTDYISFVENNYADAVASISGIEVANLNSSDFTEQIAWLNTAPNNTSQPLQFEFATPEGVQLLPNNPFNPVKPRKQGYTANFYYYNAPFVIGSTQNNMPVGYTPLLDYKFCMPSNPVYQSLNMKGNLELYKMFNCRNIAGMVRELDVYSAATDSVTGMPVIGASGNLVTPAIGSYTPSQYRFRVLIERAKQIVAQAQQMESMFLAALEKEDAENYSQLRARQDLETARATVKLQDLRIRQANTEKDIAGIQLSKATFTMDHFEDLMSAGINAYETASLLMMQVATIYQGVAAIGYAFAGASQAIAAADPLTGRISTGDALSSFAQSLSATSSLYSLQAGVLNQLASYQRRQEEWDFQKNLANFDISLANQQIKLADDNIRVVTQERQIAQMNTEHAQDSLQFLQNKFTNAELYNWMGNVLQSAYSYMLNLSTSIARTAEKQLYFERQEQAGPFILSDYWETPSSSFTSGSSGSSVDRRGLTGSARLLVDITRLDQYAFDSFKRKLQITKVISLAQNFPSEFQRFKETGVLSFELTNKLFDYDFPGHYLRLITQLKTTVVGLLPVYDQIKASLTADTTSYTVIGGTTFQRIPIKRAELDSVALSSANNATGVFEMNPMQNEILNPFEGMGVESRWEFKMPQFSNRMDFSNIADVLLTVDYTAFDSYEHRVQVLNDLENEISFNRGFSFKNNFPDQWYELAEAIEGSPSFGVTIDLKREMFPQGIENLQLNGSPLVLYFVREDGFEDEINVLDFSKPPVIESVPPVYTGGTTVSGKLINNLVNTLNSPVTKLRLRFDNTTYVNRELFSEGKIKDILLILPCKAELKSYPL